MALYLGIDTSNYTTSLALFDDKKGIVGFERQLLKVKTGEIGLRQSDAVFQHVQNLPTLFAKLGTINAEDLCGIGVSSKPRDEDGSYMPCFTVGLSFAQSLGNLFSVPVSLFSHQAGHIAAAAYSSGREDLLNREFIAFHVSGGTTEVVHVQPDADKLIKTVLISSSLDLKAGQAIDRVGQMLTLPFPAGRFLEELANKSNNVYRCKPFMRNGCPSLSGLENKCKQMFDKGEAAQDIAKYCLDYITAALILMAENCMDRFAEAPVLFSGGVMSNQLIRDAILKKFEAVFSEPSYSSDNAAGIAYLTYLNQ